MKALYEQRGLCAVIPAVTGVDEVFDLTKKALTRLLPDKPAKLEAPISSHGKVFLTRVSYCYKVY